MTVQSSGLDEINFDQFIKTANYEETVRQLDVYYGMGNYLLILEVY